MSPSVKGADDVFILCSFYKTLPLTLTHSSFNLMINKGGLIYIENV